METDPRIASSSSDSSTSGRNRGTNEEKKTRGSGWVIPTKWSEPGDRAATDESAKAAAAAALAKFPEVKNVIFWPPQSQFYLDWVAQSKPGDLVYVVQFVSVNTDMLCTVMRDLKKAGYVLCLVLYANDCSHMIAEALFLADVVHGEMARTMIGCAPVLLSTGSEFGPPYGASYGVAEEILSACKPHQMLLARAMMKEIDLWAQRIGRMARGTPDEVGMSRMVGDVTSNPFGMTIGFFDMRSRWGLNIYPIPKALRQRLHEGKHMDIHASSGWSGSV